MTANGKCSCHSRMRFQAAAKKDENDSSSSSSEEAEDKSSDDDQDGSSRDSEMGSVDDEEPALGAADGTGTVPTVDEIAGKDVCVCFICRKKSDQVGCGL